MKLTIGNLAKQANVTIETIRYYQRKRLLDEPEKPATGYRQYSTESIARIRFIKRAQQSGFTLKEISELLSLDSGHCADIKKIAEQKRNQIDRQIENLTALRNALDEMVKGCKETASSEHCSLIDTLENQTDPLP